MAATQSKPSTHPLASTQTVQRDQWHTQYDFILNCFGSTIGLGNIWRFPYMSLRYGGITFLVPYLILLLIIGIPMYVMELALGQYSGTRARQMFRRIAPLFSGVGTAMLLILAIIAFIYNMAVAWTVFFAGASFMPGPPWGRCDQEFNTVNCFAMANGGNSPKAGDDVDIVSNDTLLLQRLPSEEINVLSAETLNLSSFSDVSAHCHPLHGRYVSSSEEYFFNNVLGLGGKSLQGFGKLRWDICLCMLVAWALVAACSSQGLMAVGHIFHFTVIYPYVALILLLLPTICHDGAYKGIQFYGSFNATALWSPNLWSDAATQIFFSLGISHGDLITLASFNRLRNNCMRDGILVAVVNTLTSLLSVMVVFGMLGVTAKQLGNKVNCVHGPSLGLAFVTYPEALLFTPSPPVFSVLFFVMLITLGLNSEFILVETLTVAVVDEWPALYPYRRGISVGMCAVFFVANLCLCLDGGVRVFALFDHYAISLSQFVVALLEVVAVSWVFGADRLLDLMRTKMEIPMPAAVRVYWRLTWRYTMPAGLLAMLFFTAMTTKSATFTAGGSVMKFQPWEDGLGVLLMIAPVLVVFFETMMVLVRQKRIGRPMAEVFKPTVNWESFGEKERDPGVSAESGGGAAEVGGQCRTCNMYLKTMANTGHLTNLERDVGFLSCPDAGGKRCAVPFVKVVNNMDSNRDKSDRATRRNALDGIDNRRVDDCDTKTPVDESKT